jgi:hypothetical protein
VKKKIVTLSVILLLAMLTACGGAKDKGNNVDNNGSGAYDKYKAGPYVEMMVAGTYYIDSTVYIKGAPATIKMGVDGANSSVEVVGLPNPMRVLTINGRMYYVNDENRNYMMVDSKEATNPKDLGIPDYAGMKYKASGSGTISDLTGIDSKKYDYEEFVAGAGAKAMTVRYYFKADKLYAIQEKIGEAGSTMVINQMTKDIPEGVVNLPSGYKMVDAMGFFS